MASRQRALLRHGALLRARLADLALLGIAAFASVAVVLQFARSDLDWQRAPLSFYLIGPHAGWLVVMYFVLAGALLTLASGLYLALQPVARSVAPVLLFAVTALALATTALATTDTTAQGPSLHGYIHNIAAVTAFVCACGGMLLQSSRFRRDPSWSDFSRVALPLAVVCCVALCINMVWREWPRGLSQKIVIALIMCWLLATAWCLRRHASSRAKSNRRLSEGLDDDE